MVVIDNSILLSFPWPDVPPPTIEGTQQPVEKLRERIDYLIGNLSENREKVLVPTPVLSEILVHAGHAGPRLHRQLSENSAFRIVPFDERAAIELALMTREALSSGDKRGSGEGSWAKIKFDRQIIAIARVEGAKTIYSNDGNIRTFGQRIGLTVLRAEDLPLPPEEQQGNLEFDGPKTS